MHQLRCILAVIFAILIANPACCCAGMKPVQKEVSHSCCSGTKKEKKESACNCEASKPLITEKHSVLPGTPLLALPQPQISAPLPVTAPMAVIVSPVQPTDTGPPRKRLLMFQRFLI